MSDVQSRLDSAWKAWIDAQEAAIETVRTAESVPRTETDVAEGYRWITRISSLAQEWIIEKSDPLHPQLFQSQSEYRKLLVDNPDTRYAFSTIDDTRTYRLAGSRGEAAYVGLTFGTPIGKGAVGGRTGTTVQAHIDQFELGPGGEVDILIVPEGEIPDPRAKNVITVPPGTGQLAVRETFFDRVHDKPSDLRIDLVGEVANPILGVEEMAGKMEFAALFVQFVAATAVNMWHDTKGNINHFGGTAGSEHVAAQEDEVRSHSNAEMTYHGGRWVLGEDEAIVITVHNPPNEFLYWGLTTASAWMESLDYRYTTTNLNNHTAECSPDGDWRLVISPRDPGVTNWIDTGGRREGYMIVRWVLADRPPHPTCELVAIDSLRG
ncbi:MAG TPA: DUF1214 domain-containing protein [Acidimicrobiales bacterium]|nr:DUF1214 domain-containing protein [Acidimicrobiales bacterium]